MYLLVTPDQQYTMGLTGDMEMAVYISTNRHRVVVQWPYHDSMCVDVVTQAVWFVVHPWCLSGEDIAQELTVPVQHLYCAGSKITHQDV